MPKAAFIHNRFWAFHQKIVAEDLQCRAIYVIAWQRKMHSCQVRC